ncbi:MAG: sugar transferase [Deltaproteobacteria bacterium HGW-Deltaproteobacteria-22]|nr:MAG: sugar transferase [Deltaproteobacteria bacterium HGW-Deltaproteobacteria-22]
MHPLLASSLMSIRLETTAAAALLAASAPLSLVSAASILMFDGPPVFFRQTRLGLHRRPFSLLKFRTMRDDRITHPGRILRNLGWDELPQLVNVLRGEASFIGPRPLTPEDVERLSAEHPEMDGRFTVRPGLTGLIQVLGTRGAAFSIAVENAYAHRATALHDAQILSLTAGAFLLGKDRLRRFVARFPAWKNHLLFLDF